MSAFVALLDAEPTETRRALLAALHRAGVREAAPARGRGTLRRLLRRAPDLVLLGGSGGRSVVLAALAYRWLRPRSRLVLWLDEPPASPRLPRGLLARLADGVLLGCGLPPAEAPGTAGARLLDAAGPHDVLAFAQGPAGRQGAALGHVVVAGHLSLDAGGLDLLCELVSLCERHPGRSLHLHWTGEGELRRVLEAQLLPPNLLQCFHGALDAAGTAQLYGRCSVLLAPLRREVPAASLAAAMASGLLVLFDANCPVAGGLLGAAGIGLDRTRPGALAEALGALLDRPAAALDRLRLLGRERALAFAPPGFERRVAHAVRVVLDGGAPGAAAWTDAAALSQAAGAD